MNVTDGKKPPKKSLGGHLFSENFLFFSTDFWKHEKQCFNFFRSCKSAFIVGENDVP